jgi:hypothetical protein
MGAQLLAEAPLHEVAGDGRPDPFADDDAGARGGIRSVVHIEVHDEGTAAGAAAPGGHEPVLRPAADPR